MNRRYIIASLISFIFMTITIGLGYYLWAQQPASKNSPQQTVIIAPGSSVDKIADLLVEKDLLRSKMIFKYLVWQRNLTKKLQAGTFSLSANQTPLEIALTLTQGTNDVWVTLKEGWRAEEIGQYLAQKLEGFEYEGPEFEKECLNFQGRLFPETYLVPKSYSTTQMCLLMRKQYQDNITTQNESDWEAENWSENEILTLASIIEREAKTLPDKKLVSGVLRNRLELGMPLQVDATLQFIKGFDSQSQTWWATPTAADKNLQSPFNTYLSNELPPGPICNPGKDAIQAATYPTTTTALYYISNRDGSKMYFADTYEQHQKNINAYLK